MVFVDEYVGDVVNFGDVVLPCFQDLPCAPSAKTGNIAVLLIAPLGAVSFPIQRLRVRASGKSNMFCHHSSISHISVLMSVGEQQANSPLRLFNMKHPSWREL